MFAIYLTRILAQIAMFFLLARKRVYGLENLPPKGTPYIVVSNHVSVADSILLIISAPPMEMRFLAAEKWMRHWLWGRLLGALGGIEIQRGEVDRAALHRAFAALKEGYPLGIAPEGTRSPNAQLMEGKHGAAYMASRADVLILPVAIVNTDQLFRNFRRLRPTQLEVHIGQPFKLPELGRRVRQPDLPALTHYIMVHIARHLPARYHGHYANSPALQALLAGHDPWPHCLAAEEETSQS